MRVKSASKKGWTLVEVMVASAIYAIAMAGVYAAFHSGFFGYHRIADQAAATRLASQIFERLDADLRNACALGEEDARFSGTDQRLDFLTLLDVFYEGRVVQRYARVFYEKSGSDLTRQVFKDKESMKSSSLDFSRDALGPEEGFDNIAFSYGRRLSADKPLDWIAEWPEKKSEGQAASASAMPEAVKVKLSLKKNKRAFDLERIIYLPPSLRSGE